MTPVSETAAPAGRVSVDALDEHRRNLTGFCYRMLGSPFEAEDAVQETMLRAWRALGGFDGRSSLSTWLHRIATNVCVDMLKGRRRRATPMDLGPAQEPVVANLHTRAEATWIEPIPGTMLDGETDPADVAVSNETVKLALIAALQRLPARQRAVLILCEVLRWQATEVAVLLDTSVASVNSALQRARATLAASGVSTGSAQLPLDAAQQQLLQRYVDAFQRYNLDALTSCIRSDAMMSMPPYDLWLDGRDSVLRFFYGPGIGCEGSVLVPTSPANGTVAFGQYKPSAGGSGYEPWALQVVEIGDGGVAELTFFLDTARLFPLFDLPPHAG
ncbi:MAG: sigma-70 family RNA polymerase sigma factor [Candidatus Dormibacteraeota bacterium]|nr:sigma-70 family RNA polymerase sigma factor [Candidatus Dormibacteraeota bacterium]